MSKPRLINATFLFFVITFFHKVVIAQSHDELTKNITKDTKFGLALSGGGAKGFAHLGLLNLVDSLGIKIHYITGTSMGGILGGLYAMGYDAKSLKKTIFEVDWKRVLSNKIPLNSINISEKSEYDKYILEFPLLRGVPLLPSSYIEGQYMSEVLNTLTFPAKHINDFSKLKIPLALTSSDILNGGLVMQTKGSLPLAIRSTLAIPAAFTPVYIDGKLLVDGGLDRNYPVQEVKDMGADFVIGGYTGFRLFSKKEIQNPLKMIYQTHAIRSVQDFNIQKQNTDVLINFIKPLGDLTTKDFGAYKKIIEIGEAEARKHLPELKAISEAQKKAGITLEHSLIKEIKKPTLEFTFNNEDGSPLDDTKEVEEIKVLLNLEEGCYHDVAEVNKGIDRVFGLRRYEKVYYTYTNINEGLIMNIYVKRATKGAFKLALHYDNEQSVGIILNYTYRNFLLRQSRIFMTMDISEQFKARIDLVKHIDKSYKWFIGAESLVMNLKSNDFLFKTLSSFSLENNENMIGNINYGFINHRINLGYNLLPNTLIYFGPEFNSERFTQALTRIDLVMASLDSRKVYRHSNFTLNLRLEHNSLDKKYYSTKGSHLQVGLRYFFGHNYKLYETKNTSSLFSKLFNPKTSNTEIPNTLVSVTVNGNFVSRISRRLSLRTNPFLGYFFSSSDQSKTYLFFNQRYGLGGSEYNDTMYNPEFPGFQQKELKTSSLFKLGMELQYKVKNNFYLSPVLSYGKIIQKVFLDPDLESDMIGYGISLGYDSLLGPINFNFSKNNSVQFWRAYLSIGFKF